MTLDSRPASLRINRLNMAEFIAADPIDIVITRSPKVATAAGGWVWGDPEVLTSQRFRLTPFKRRLYNYQKASTAGAPQVEDYVLVGYWNCDVLPGDQFTYNDDLYTIDTVEPKMDDRPRSDRVVIKLTIQVEDKAPPA